MKRINYRHYICIAITLGFVACTVFLFPNALGRFIEGARDFGLSVAYYFCKLFGFDDAITPTVNDMPKFPFFDFGGFAPVDPSAPSIPSAPSTPLPDTWTGLQSDWARYWRTWASAGNALDYLSFLANLLYYLSYALLIIIPLFLLFKVVFKRYMRNENNDYNKDSKPLRAFKFLAKWTYRPVKKWLTGFVSFLRENGTYLKIWLIIWLFNFNVLTIILEFIAFYLYFAATFDVSNIYRQVYKLFLDLSVPLTFIPLWAWVLIGIVLFDRFRKKIAYMRLSHMEMRNRGFINARPIVTMVCGTMGKKKTTTITDMALSQEVIFRHKAFEKILETDLKFPYFPWINFENAIKKAMANHSIYNLATCKRFVYSKYKKFRRRSLKYYCFGYDYERYGFEYNDELKTVNLWEVLETYAKLYFIYIIQSSLLISNYSVRVDNILSDVGNFPLWNTDFFRRDSRLMDAYSRHAHIIDFDALRLGRKVIENNMNKDMFEFGVVVITEIGKERGNNLELKEVKRKDEDANQKNDLFNAWLKMIRHSATVDNFPFVKVITDEQRPASWGADARDLCEIVHIRESGDTVLSMPFFSLGELLYSWLFGKFENIYHEYRFARGDNTLLMHIIKTMSAKLHHYYTRIYNRFSFCTLRVQLESGTMDGAIDENKYYIMSKKVYAKRFSTDCFSEYFTNKAMRSPLGLPDMPEYRTERAAFYELKDQNSYFINDLLNMENTESED